MALVVDDIFLTYLLKLVIAFLVLWYLIPDKKIGKSGFHPVVKLLVIFLLILILIPDLPILLKVSMVFLLIWVAIPNLHPVFKLLIIFLFLWFVDPHIAREILRALDSLKASIK